MLSTPKVRYSIGTATSFGMEDHCQIPKLYQQYPDPGQGGMSNVYSSSNMAARFRHPPISQHTSVADTAQNCAAQSHGFSGGGHFAGNMIPSGFQHPNYNVGGSLGYAGHHQSPTAQYAPTYYYGNQQQTAQPGDQASQDQLQKYEASNGRNASIVSSSSQFSMPNTPQSQYPSSSQESQFGARAGDLVNQNDSSPFEATSYTTGTGLGGLYQSSTQMLPPGHVGGYRHIQQHYNLPGSSSMDEAYKIYQRKVSEIYTLVRDSRLGEAQEPLLHISLYLLGNAESLGRRGRISPPEGGGCFFFFLKGY